MQLEHYYPLAVGRSWRYRLIFLGQERGELKQRVEAVRHSQRSSFWKMERQLSGAEPEQYSVVVSAEELRIASATVLRAPIEPGARWHDSGPEGVLLYEVERIGFSESVPAGRFADCVEVVARRNDVEIQRTIFAPGTGMIRHRAAVPGGWMELLLEEDRTGELN